MTPSEIKDILTQFKITPSKSKGQHFLLDERVIEEMVNIGDVKKTDLVLEVGPGLGILTKQLATAAKSLVVVELDNHVIDYLKAELLKEYQNISLIEGDVLAGETYHDFVGWLSKQTGISVSEDVRSDNYKQSIKSLDFTFKLVANLPYQITSGILRQFTETSPKPSSLTVMVQKEVGERMAAPAGKMSLLSLAMQVYGSVDVAASVPSSLFYPAPKVESVIVHIDLTKPNKAFAKLSEDQQEQFWRMAKSGFASRRKQLKNNLARFFENDDAKTVEILENMGLSATVRAQELTVEQWSALAEMEM